MGSMPIVESFEKRGFSTPVRASENYELEGVWKFNLEMVESFEAIKFD